MRAIEENMTYIDMLTLRMIHRSDNGEHETPPMLNNETDLAGALAFLKSSEKGFTTYTIADGKRGCVYKLAELGRKKLNEYEKSPRARAAAAAFRLLTVVAENAGNDFDQDVGCMEDLCVMYDLPLTSSASDLIYQIEKDIFEGK